LRNFLGLGTAFFIAGLLVLSASGVQRQTPQWRSGIDLVVVDASVLDYDRRPVRGLTVADFTILEDGHPRSVATISEINASDTVTPIGVAVPAGVWVREVPADVESNAIPAGGRLLALVLDDALPMAPGEGVRARELALDVIDRLAPSDVAAVVFTSGREQNQNFTADQARLRSAVGRYHPRTDLRFDRLDPRQGAAPPLYFAATATLRNLVRGLGVLGPRRKAILWVSAGIPLELGKVFGSDVWSSQLRDEWRDLLAAAGGANVTFYDLDPGGLRGQTIDLHIGPTSWNTTGEDISPGGTREYGAVNRRFLLDVAANTGGIAVTGSNDPGPGIEQLFTETGSYYLLGFESAFPPGKDVRRLEVRVKRPGVTVHSRTQYSREAARASAEPATEKALLSGALGGLLPVSDIGL
jgi:VWFA-related protein